MDKLIGKKAHLDGIRLSEGTQFECDEDAILEEFNRKIENKSGLAIKALSIFGGFLATLAFIGFLVIGGLYNSKFGLLIVGVGFIISAIWLNKEYDKLIIDTFSISIYVSGLALLAFGLSGMGIDEDLITLLICCIAITSLIIAQNFILSFISVLTISGSFLFLIVSNHLYNLIHLYIAISTLLLAFIFLNEAKIISSNVKLSRVYNPLKIGSVISLLAGLFSVSKRDILPLSQNYIWISSVVLILVTLYLIDTIIKINEIKTIKSKIAIYSLSSLILMSALFSPSIIGALTIILLSFLVNYKTGLAIGIISIIYFISQYYYDLNFTLLTKSIILFASGIVFLLLYLFTIQKRTINEKI